MLSQYWPIPLLLLPGVFLFDWWLVVLQGLLMLSVWSFVKKEGSGSFGSALVSKHSFYGFLVLFAFFLGLRLLPFWFSAHPLGYDTGIYRFEIWSSLQALPDFVSGLFLGLPLLTDIAGLFGFSLDQVLYGGFLFAHALLFFSLWVFLRRRWGVRVAFFGVFLLVISTIQWKAYSMFLYKQVFALGLLLYSFFLFEKRSYLLLPVLFYLAVLQPLDAFLFVASLAFFSISAWFRFPKDRRYFTVLSMTGLFALFSFWIVEPGFWAEAWQIFSDGLFQKGVLELHLQEGVFFSLADYAYQAAIVFACGSLGWFFSLKKEGLGLIHVYAVFVVFWVLLGFFFYQRLLLQLDLIMIVFAAYALCRFYRSFVYDRFSRISIFLMGGLLSVPIFLQVYHYEPHISVSSQKSILEFCVSLGAGNTIAVSDSYSTPWVRGWCLDQIVFGPGLFANKWDADQWDLFWNDGSVEEVRDLLDHYERPLYFYSSQKNLRERFSSELFERVAEGWYRVRGEVKSKK